MNNDGSVEQFKYRQTQPNVEYNNQRSRAEDNTVIVEWDGSEFIEHQKSIGWFLILSLCSTIGSVLIYFITRSIFSSIVTLLAVVAFGLIAKQKPRTLHYSLLGGSIRIGTQQYSYDDFKTFSINQDVALFNFTLQPIKRFTPVLTIYFPPEDGEVIFDTLAAHLPHEEQKNDPIENLMRRIRF